MPQIFLYCILLNPFTYLLIGDLNVNKNYESGNL